MSSENQRFDDRTSESAADHQLDPAPDESISEAPSSKPTATGGKSLPPRHLHPTSLLFDIMSQARRYIIPAVIAVFSAASGSRFGLVLAIFIFVPSILTSVFRYFTLRYSIQGGQLVVTQGLFFRRIRTVPAGRIQNIDLVQNPLHRLCHVAEVRVETASGTEPEATLRVLSMQQVAELRNEIFASRAAQQPTGRATAAEPALQTDSEFHGAPRGRVILEIPISWLLRAGLASNRGMLIIGLVVGAFYQFDMEDQINVEKISQIRPEGISTSAAVIGSLIAIVAVLVALRILGIVWYLLRFYGYRLSLYDEDLRISCGLLTKVSATLPRRRIQFISIHRTLLMRWMGLSAIRLETAGGAGKQDEDAKSTVSRRWFVPVVADDRVADLLNELRPGLHWDEARFHWHALAPRASRRLVRLAVIQSAVLAMSGVIVTRPWGWTIGIVGLPLLVWWAIRKSRSMRYARFEDGLVFRSGVLNRKTSLTFFEKIQSMCIDQSPFDRRWKMAQLSVDTAAAGPADHRIQVPLLDEDFARQELRDLASRTASHMPSYA